MGTSAAGQRGLGGRARPAPGCGKRKMRGCHMTSTCPLVLVEWEDSTQPISQWAYLSTFEVGNIVRCVSVGWLIHDGDDAKAVAPNMGSIGDVEAMQVSGVIRIPARCITRMVTLDEPEITSSGPSSRPDRERTLQAS